MAAHMGPMDLTKKFSLLLLLALTSLPSVAASAEFKGGVSSGVSYTDNVLLNVSPTEVDEIIYQASPFFSFNHESPNFDSSVSYSFDWYRYSDLKSTSKYHRGDAIVTGKAWQDTLLVELGARRSQRLGDPNEVIPGGRFFNSGNLVDQDEWWLNPRLVRDLGGGIQLNANYRFAKYQRDDSRYQDGTNNSGAMSFDNYRVGTGLTWALRYGWRRAEFEVSAPWENQQATAEVGYWVNAKTRVLAAGGKESDWLNPFDPSMEDTFWEAGFAYLSGENLLVELAAGERSFGSTWRGKLDYKFRKGNTKLSYSESPTTQDFTQTVPLLNTLNPADLEDFLSAPGSPDRYISSRFEWTLNVELRRTEIGIRIFDEDRSERIDALGSTLDDQAQTGVAVDFSWQAGVRTELSVTGSTVDRETSSGAKATYKSAGLNIKYRLGSRSDISLGYRYDDEEPRGEARRSRDYVANTVSLLFTFTI